MVVKVSVGVGESEAYSTKDVTNYDVDMTERIYFPLNILMQKFSH